MEDTRLAFFCAVFGPLSVPPASCIRYSFEEEKHTEKQGTFRIYLLNMLLGFWHVRRYIPLGIRGTWVRMRNATQNWPETRVLFGSIVYLYMFARPKTKVWYLFLFCPWSGQLAQVKMHFLASSHCVCHGQQGVDFLSALTISQKAIVVTGHSRKCLLLLFVNPIMRGLLKICWPLAKQLVFPPFLNFFWAFGKSSQPARASFLVSLVWDYVTQWS